MGQRSFLSTFAVIFSATLFIGCDSSGDAWKFTDFSGDYRGDITYSYRTEDGGTSSETGSAKWSVNHNQATHALDIDLEADIELTLGIIVIPAKINISRSCKLISVPGVGDNVCQIGSILPNLSDLLDLSDLPDCKAGPIIQFESSPSHRIRFDQPLPETAECPITNISGTLNRQ